MGGLAITAWAAAWSLLLFGSLKWAGILRVGVEDEFKGMDLIKHGESAYPAAAWVEYQYSDKKNSRGCHQDGIGTEMSVEDIKEMTDENSQHYDNSFEMMSMAGTLFRTSSALIGVGNISKNPGWSIDLQTPTHSNVYLIFFDTNDKRT